MGRQSSYRGPILIIFIAWEVIATKQKLYLGARTPVYATQGVMHWTGTHIMVQEYPAGCTDHHGHGNGSMNMDLSTTNLSACASVRQSCFHNVVGLSANRTIIDKNVRILFKVVQAADLREKYCKSTTMHLICQSYYNILARQKFVV